MPFKKLLIALGAAALVGGTASTVSTTASPEPAAAITSISYTRFAANVRVSYNWTPYTDSAIYSMGLRACQTWYASHSDSVTIKDLQRVYALDYNRANWLESRSRIFLC